ncbi:MAG: hypothetical protein MJ250_03620 [Alphaproteobacteria bacterium]|nr:hypothetical protein [Alphaproteobacteria bacterium]
MTYKYFKIGSKVVKVEYNEAGPRCAYEKVGKTEKINNKYLSEIMFDDDGDIVEVSAKEY